MIKYFETIIVGGGPAGSTCAWHLVKQRRNVLVIDKEKYPRVKLCAGWITDKVISDLELSDDIYPYPILKLDTHMHVGKLPFSIPWIPTTGSNYSIRRVEFDHWLLERSQAPVVQHTIKSIRRDGDLYIIDEKYSCKFLIGAGGTMCPVRRSVFNGKRMKSRQLATLETEFEYPARSDTCHLFFVKRGLVGYSWYVPKANGFLNIGIGGKSTYFKKSETNIHDHYRHFLEDLVDRKLLDEHTATTMKSKGHPYYLFTHKGKVRDGNCFLIGDSAGLSSVDMGEGIGPAIESAIMVADEISGIGKYNKNDITKYSFGGLAQVIAKKTIGKFHAEGNQ